MEKKVIFYHPSMEKVAIEAAFLAGAHLGKIQWSFFKDGWPDFFIKNVETDVRDRDVVFISSFHDQTEVFNQLSLIYAFPRYFARSLNVIIPFFPVGTMERIDEEGQIATAKSLARMLSATPMTKSGPAIFTIFDIHALQGRFYFDDRILPDLQTAMPVFLDKIRLMPDISIAFPDDGAFKRFGKNCKGYPLIICNKIKQNSKRIVTIKEGEVKGRHVVIVDDLVQTGGTLLECRNTLMAAGAIGVSAAVMHGVFPENSWQQFTPDLFKHVWITDSCPKTVLAVGNLEPFRVLSLAPLISEIIILT